MNKKMSKRQKDLKSKLMAAICMLLVSSIMMVSTTYAWFTLSTAPEVTGITTAVGANGNLEMALLPKNGDVNSITSEAGDSVKAIDERNVTWGNLVDLSDSTVYGLDKITLYPSALYLGINDVNKDAHGNPTKLEAAILSTPEYGADGRVSELVTKTVTGYYDKTAQSFAPNADKGVRAVGTASGMTDRQVDYRNARSAANSAKAQAATLASQSLNTNGSALANIAITHGMGDDTGKYKAADVAAMRSIISDLNGDGGILDQIETAYLQYILAYAASEKTGTADTVWSAVKGAVTAEGATLDSVTGALTSNNVTLPSELTNAIAAYNGAVTKVNTANTELQTLEAALATNPDETFDWSEISKPLIPLADTSAMTINGFKASEVKANLGALVSSVTAQGGLKVIMATGGGVYADIADQSGDYTASITIEEVEYNGIVLNNMTARMETKTTVSPVYLDQIGVAVEAAGAPQGTGDAVLPISDMYGYIIDLAFRTNAPESDLLLQAEATDRIYDGNSNEQTMGHGSTMTFQATTTDFTNDQVKTLMSAIRIVFFNPNSMDVVATAKLDVANAELTAEGICAEMYVYKLNSGATATTYNATAYASNSGKIFYTKSTEDKYTEADTEAVAAAAAAGGKLFVASGDSYVEEIVVADNGKTYYTKSTEDKYTPIDDTTASTYEGTLYTTVTTTGEERAANNKIMALTQNAATPLSCLVYLDGNNVSNASVAATASTSMKGKMNLQFASSANLVPMDYAALNQAAGSNTGGGSAEPSTPASEPSTPASEPSTPASEPSTP